MMSATARSYVLHGVVPADDAPAVDNGSLTQRLVVALAARREREFVEPLEVRRDHVRGQYRSQAGSDRDEVGRFSVTDEVGDQYGVHATARFRATTAAARIALSLSFIKASSTSAHSTRKPRTFTWVSTRPR